MQTVLFFQKSDWNKHQICSMLNGLGMKYELRSGFSNLVAICESNQAVNNILTDRKIIAINYDNTAQAAEKYARILDANISKIVPLSELLDKERNLSFDLSNFGFMLIGGVPIEHLYNLVRQSRFGDNIDILSESDCTDIIDNSNVSEDIKKLILDIFALRACAIHLISRLHNNSDTLAQYSSVFLLSFVTRAQYEKLMLLVAKIDSTISYKRLDNSKKIKSTFVKESETSNLEITKHLRDFIINLELLDDNYRTPEVHKLGRILGLISQGYYSSMINEVLSFQNEANFLFIEVCNYIRQTNSQPKVIPSSSEL